MVDDTATFLSFDSEETAELVVDALNSPNAKAFLSAFAFPDAKRPYTVDLLSKLNLGKLVEMTHGRTRVPQALVRF